MGNSCVALQRLRPELHEREELAALRESELSECSKAAFAVLRAEFQDREVSFRKQESDIALKSAREFGEQQDCLVHEEVDEIEREYDAVKQAYHGTRAELRESETETSTLVKLVGRLREETARLSDSLRLEQQRVVDIEQSTRTHLDLIDREVLELNKSKQALSATCETACRAPDALNSQVASPARGRHRNQGEVPSARLSPRSIAADHAELVGRASAVARTS